MFIPYGKMVHENLATSYVQVDALVSDLCQGGFSGIVEVILREADNFVVINAGEVAAVIERRGERNWNSGDGSYARASVEQLAEQARLERGHVSIYSYDTSTALAISGRINAQPLYVGLSNEFTDLEKMVSKLIRERDREWFIETSTERGPAALIHIREGQYRIFYSTEAASSDTYPHIEDGSAGGESLNEDSESSSFDVYFTRVGEAAAAAAGDGSSHTEMAKPVPSPLVEISSNDASVQPESSPATPNSIPEPDPPDETDPMGSDWEAATPGLTADELEREEDFEHDQTAHHAVAPLAKQFSIAAAEVEAVTDVGLASNPAWDLIEAESLDPSPDHVRVDGEAGMAEIKRLLGEISKTIEEASQSVGRPDGFSMHLRAGQLKVADRYPFLDPFAGEFEYLAGEIVFVGHATAEEFVAGLSEALKFAVSGVLNSIPYGDRFRSYVTEDLRKLLARNRADLESYGLDRVIERIIEF